MEVNIIRKFMVILAILLTKYNPEHSQTGKTKASIKIPKLSHVNQPRKFLSLVLTMTSLRYESITSWQITRKCI
jgi:hypothetical protein